MNTIANQSGQMTQLLKRICQVPGQRVLTEINTLQQHTAPNLARDGTRQLVPTQINRSQVVQPSYLCPSNSFLDKSRDLKVFKLQIPKGIEPVNRFEDKFKEARDEHDPTLTGIYTAQLAIEEQKESEKNAGDNSTQEVEVRKLDMQNQNGEVEEIEEGQIEEQWLQISPGKSSSGRLKETTFEQVRTASRFSVLSDLEETEKPENQNEDVVEKVMEGTELRNEENEIEVIEKRKEKEIREDGEHRVEKEESSVLRQSIPRNSKTNHRTISTVAHDIACPCCHVLSVAPRDHGV
ncbi:hypothetical protein HID58_029510 [Brassica napus]|uniref:Uncharacterized protein n=1 Tax=Brassica napus TaxID=3708 RepID=A0ABQ8CDC3_BRANA|nr:hypothetical protein HID58_029510 [Brassica napus]